jgi:ribonuclease-3
MTTQPRIFRVYNPKNRYLTLDHIQHFLDEVGLPHRARNLALYQEAFTHKSYCSTRKRAEPTGNARYDIPLSCPVHTIPLQERCMDGLEYLGDAYLQKISSQYIYDRLPLVRQDEGAMTKLRSRLVRTETLSHVARCLGFAPFLLLSDYEEDFKMARQNDAFLEDSYEAFVGALAMDCETQRERDELTHLFVVASLEKYVDMVRVFAVDDNFKDIYMRYCQRQFDGRTPTYRADDSKVVIETNAVGDEITIFHSAVYDPNRMMRGEGRGRSKRDAEQNAARAALMSVGIDVDVDI